LKIGGLVMHRFLLVIALIALNFASSAFADDVTLGQKGVIIVGGKKVDYLDLASDDPVKGIGREVTVYGYTNYFSEGDPSKSWGYRFDFSIFEGGAWLNNMKIMQSSDPAIDVVIAPSRSKTYAEPLTETFAAMRKQVFKALTVSKGGKALIKVVGKTAAYSDSMRLYISAETVEILN